jgi:hypothetical protein
MGGADSTRSVSREGLILEEKVRKDRFESQETSGILKSPMCLEWLVKCRLLYSMCCERSVWGSQAWGPKENLISPCLACFRSSVFPAMYSPNWERILYGLFPYYPCSYSFSHP